MTERICVLFSSTTTNYGHTQSEGRVVFLQAFPQIFSLAFQNTNFCQLKIPETSTYFLLFQSAQCKWCNVKFLVEHLLLAWAIFHTEIREGEIWHSLIPMVLIISFSHVNLTWTLLKPECYISVEAIAIISPRYENACDLNTSSVQWAMSEV